jgi:hypothetical protein
MLLDTTFSILEPKTAAEWSDKGKLYIPLVVETRHHGFVVCAKMGKAPPTTHLHYLILARQIESRKEMSRVAQITETQMLAKMRK